MTKPHSGATRTQPDDITVAPRRSLKYGKRIFDLNLTDRIEGVWDETIPIVQQTIIEGVGIAPKILASWPEMSKRCDTIFATFQLTTIEEHHHVFEPGLSGVFILGESHLALHSWPERRYMNMDIVTCTRRGVDPVRLADMFTELFHPESLRCHRITF